MIMKDSIRVYEVCRGTVLNNWRLGRESIMPKGYKFLKPHLSVQTNEAEYIPEIKYLFNSYLWQKSSLKCERRSHYNI